MANEFLALAIGVGWILACTAVLFYAISYHKRNEMTKSESYKKYLTNMYVASKVRSLAEGDDLDLKVEERAFSEYVALSDKERIDTLDEKIEAELIERVGKEKDNDKKEEEDF